MPARPTVVRRLRSLVRQRLRSAPDARPGHVAPGLTYRAEFAAYLAGRRGIGRQAAQDLIAAAEAQFTDGWGGADYRRFTQVALETLRPLHDEDTDERLIDTYRFHAPFDFLRMLSYPIPAPAEIAPIVGRLGGASHIRIVDYGCGLAQRSIAVSRALQAGGATVTLTLLDIRREHHFEFLAFLCRGYGIECRFIEVDGAHLYPELPEHDLCDNVSVLEHVRHPERVIANTDRALRPGGLFLAAVDDEAPEMMHIHPDLSGVRARLATLGYARLEACCRATLFQKPLDPRWHP